jgi:hypothetical protein
MTRVVVLFTNLDENIDTASWQKEIIMLRSKEYCPRGRDLGNKIKMPPKRSRVLSPQGWCEAWSPAAAQEGSRKHVSLDEVFLHSKLSQTL